MLFIRGNEIVITVDMVASAVRSVRVSNLFYKLICIKRYLGIIMSFISDSHCSGGIFERCASGLECIIIIRYSLGKNETNRRLSIEYYNYAPKTVFDVCYTVGFSECAVIISDNIINSLGSLCLILSIKVNISRPDISKNFIVYNLTITPKRNELSVVKV